MLTLNHLAKFITMKAKNIHNKQIQFFVRARENRNNFNKIVSRDVKIKEIHESYWAISSMKQSIYFKILDSEPED